MSNWAAAAEIEALLMAPDLAKPLPGGHPVFYLLDRLAGESLSRRQIQRILNGNRSS